MKLLLPSMLFIAILTSNNANADCPDGYHPCWVLYCCVDTSTACHKTEGKCYNDAGKVIPKGMIKQSSVQKNSK
jgi:hypothetical protein